jgi:hypothetical protein
MPVYFENKWHMISVVKQDAIGYTTTPAVGENIFFDDYQDVYGGGSAPTFSGLFPAVSGSPTVSFDSSRFYSGFKSIKMAAGGSAGAIEVATEESPINATNGGKNTLSFMVYPDVGVTSVRSNFRYNSTDSKVTHTVVPETWNLVTRTFTNPAPITTLSVRIETFSDSQTIWVDEVAMVKGSDAFVRFNSSSSGSCWFGKDIDNPSTQQLQFDIQNVMTYKTALGASTIFENYRTFMGDRSAVLASAGSGINRVPSSGTSVSDPEEVLNRNPDTGDTLFTTNPVFLVNEWQVLAIN